MSMVRYAVLMARSRVVNIENFQQFTAINVLADPGHVGGNPLIPNCIETVLHWTMEDGKEAHNVLHGTASPSFTPTTAVADALLSALTTGSAWTGYAAELHPTTNLFAISLRDRRSANSALVDSNSGNHPGTATGEALPNETALCVTLRTALSGPGQRGRAYLPGFAAVALSPGNLVSSAAMTAATTWTNTWLSAWSGVGLPLALAQPPRNAYTGSTGTAHPARAAGLLPITALGIRDNHWDSQRRRGLK
jgi:hypothetical protein